MIPPIVSLDSSNGQPAGFLLRIKWLFQWLRSKPFVLAAFLVFGNLSLGTIGYMLIEGWDLLDSLFMTVITISTIGFGEIHPLSPPGRVFTIGLIFSSCGVVGYSIAEFSRILLEGEFNKLIQGRRMEHAISNLKNHVILCGGGWTGRSIATELLRSGTPFVLIEKNPATLELSRSLGDFPHLIADATLDESLERAGITRAIGLISALSEDKDNVFVVLSARSMNPSLRIVSRVIDLANRPKLEKAGANEIVSPNTIGGSRMAALMVRPEEVAIPADSQLVEKTLADANIGKQTGLLVVAIRHQRGGYKFNPGAQTVFRDGDILIVLGTESQHQALRRLSQPRAGQRV